METPANQLCDTLPAARLAGHSNSPPQPVDRAPPRVVAAPFPRKLCVRHQRMADEGTNLKLQSSLDKLPVEEREAVNAIWSSFSSSSHPRRALILQGLLTMCCFSQLSLLTEQLAHLIRIDPFSVLPQEVCLRILRHLDATSLCRAAQVTKHWRKLADDDALWKGICEQHIGQRCHKCGWCLPILEKRRTYSSPAPTTPSSSSKRTLDDPPPSNRPVKRCRSEEEAELQSLSLLLPTSPMPLDCSTTRPWKHVYSERMTIERNWRRGRCTVRILKGHSDSVMCLQFAETLPHPDFPILISGSFDRTARVWNLDTGAQIHCLKGHTRAIRALQFDNCKLITGSMDNTLKVWDWRRGTCIRTLTGHTQGVVALNFDDNVLASGSVDTTVRVWNLRTGGKFTLTGHQDWVNAVQLWDSNSYDSYPSSTAIVRASSPDSENAPQIDPGKMLFSASDDGTIRLWDLVSKSCVRQFVGHMAQVQSMKLLLSDDCDAEANAKLDSQESASTSTSNDDSSSRTRPGWPLFENRKKPVLISGSLDNTIKMWDIDTGEAVRTFFGHIEGVWGVAADKLRLISASHDRTIKLWSRETGRSTQTLVGHRAAVGCVALGEDKIVSGSDDNDIRIWSFSA